MDNQNVPGFISIDDDLEFNMITDFTIKAVHKDAEVHTFSQPEKGLEFIEGMPVDSDDWYILLLDINMPTLSGWEVLEKIKILDKKILNRLKIFVLSSSVSLRDKELADKNPLVSGFIEKPLRKASLKEILGLCGIEV